MAEEKYVLVEHLSSIFDLIKKIDNIENTAEKIKILESNDTRKTFFKMLVTSLRVYYTGYNSILVASKIDFKKLNTLTTENIHIGNFSWVLDPKYQKDSYLSVLKMNLINDCWVCFESAIRNICFLNFPRTTKYKNKIWDIYNVYLSFNLNDDYKEFLNFFRHCRNAMHNNSFHDPKRKEDYEIKHKIKNTEYILKQGEKITIYDSDILEIVEKLSDVTLDMWKNLNYPGFIPDRYNSK